MAEDKKSKKSTQPIDPYTGEETPLAEDADNIEEIIPVDNGDRAGSDYLLKEETSMDHVSADNDADAVAKRSTRYTEDEEIEAIFEERQGLARGGRKKLEDELDEHHSQSPKLTGGDLDAKWDSAASVGEETVGGSTPTPDQDVVDELGQAVGLTYDDDEPLGGEEKLRERDRRSLEPNKESQEANPNE